MPVAQPAAWPLATGASVSDRLRPAPRGALARAAADRLASGRPTILVADPCSTPTTEAVRRNAGQLSGAGVDAVVVEEVADRPALTAVLRAAIFQEAGVAVWCEVATHDRNRVAVEGDLAALSHLGVAAVVCGSPGTSPLDLGVADVIRLARYAGHLVSVRADPADPPEPVDAGAEAALTAAATSASPGDLPSIPTVVVDDPAVATARAVALLALPGVAGVLLRAADGVPEDERAARLACTAERLRR